MNKFGKTLLVGTSLTPILFVCAVNSAMNCQWRDTGWFAGLFVAFTFVFVYILTFVRKRLPPQDIVTEKVKPADKEVLAFLVSYLIPFFSRASSAFTGEVVSAFVIILIIGVIVYHSSAYTFNPLLAMCGFKFYEVECSGMTYLLISRQHLRTPRNRIIVRHLNDYIYIDDSYE